MKLPHALETIVELFKTTIERWSKHEIYRFGAAFAYYATFSFFPLLLLLTTAIGFFVGEGEPARERLVSLLAPKGSAMWEVLDSTVREMQDNTSARGLSALVGLVSLIFSASGAFVELDNTLNRVWSIGPRKGEGIVGSVWVTVREQVSALAIVMLLGVTLVASLVTTTVIGVLSRHASPLLGGLGGTLARMIEIAVSFGLHTAALTVTFHFVPRCRPPARAVVGGAALAAGILIIFKEVVARYLVELGGFSAYGIVGGLLGLETWIFFSSQTIFFVAQLTQVHVERASTSPHWDARVGTAG